MCYLLKLTLICCFFTLASGCDIPGRLVIVNKTDREAIVRYKSAFQSLPESNGTELRISNKKKENKKTILFGFGHSWTDEAIADFASVLGFIEIEANGKKTILSDEREVRDFLKARRRGLMKREVRIKIK